MTCLIGTITWQSQEQSLKCIKTITYPTTLWSTKLFWLQNRLEQTGCICFLLIALSLLFFQTFSYLWIQRSVVSFRCIIVVKSVLGCTKQVVTPLLWCFKNWGSSTVLCVRLRFQPHILSIIRTKQYQGYIVTPAGCWVT